MHLSTGMGYARAGAARLSGAFRAFGARALDVALPPLCPACREPVGSPHALCASCWSKLDFIARPYCERLGTPFPHDSGRGLLSPEAIASPPAYGQSRAAVSYNDTAAALVHAFKYGDRLDLGPLLGRWTARAIEDLSPEADALVPVPLHWRRLWARRFNQSALLARFVGESAGLPVLQGVLKRVRSTPQQVGRTRAQRAENVQGAFRVAPEGRVLLKGRRLILVDDVLTTGATAEACARALLRAGAANVDVLTFARVVNPPRTPI